jgi:hypothetical protein
MSSSSTNIALNVFKPETFVQRTIKYIPCGKRKEKDFTVGVNLDNHVFILKDVLKMIYGEEKGLKFCEILNEKGKLIIVTQCYKDSEFLKYTEGIQEYSHFVYQGGMNLLEGQVFPECAVDAFVDQISSVFASYQTKAWRDIDHLVSEYAKCAKCVYDPIQKERLKRFMIDAKQRLEDQFIRQKRHLEWLLEIPQEEEEPSKRPRV